MLCEKISIRQQTCGRVIVETIQVKKLLRWSECLDPQFIKSLMKVKTLYNIVQNRLYQDQDYYKHTVGNSESMPVDWEFLLVYWQSSSYYSILSNQQLNKVVIIPTTIGY